MKKKLISAILIFLTFSSFSQSKPDFSARMLMDEGTGFNFFVGNDAKDFTTTPKAFGSGIFDFSGQINVWNVWLIKPSNFPIGVATTVGLKIQKFRFEDNYYFGIDTNALLIDVNPDHYYNNTFFSRHGSKLVTGKIFIPLMIYLPVHNWFNSTKDNFGIYGGAFYEGYLFSYHKLFYEDQKTLVKNKTTNESIKQYFTKNGFGVRAGLKISNFFIFGQYMLTPIFNNMMPYDLHETKIGINYYFNYKKLIPDFDEDDNDSDEKGFGTDAK